MKRHALLPSAQPTSQGEPAIRRQDDRIPCLFAAQKAIIVTWFVLCLPAWCLAQAAVTLPHREVPRAAEPPIPGAAKHAVSHSGLRDTTEQLPPVESAAIASVRHGVDKPISSITTDTRAPEGELPPSPGADFFSAQPTRKMASSTYQSAPLRFRYANAAMGFCHPPLYFEQVQLERYGIAPRRGAVLLSAAHFFGTIPALPYKMTMVCPCERVCTYGRRSNFHLCHCPEHRWRTGLAALTQASTVAGLIVVMP